MNLRRRWVEHKHRLTKQTHHNSRLQRSWNKYGAKAFTCTVLEQCDRLDLTTAEDGWLTLFDAANNRDCYNFLPKAHSATGYVPSAETRKKISEALKGRPLSPETRAKLRTAKIGVKQSPTHIYNRTYRQLGQKRIKKTGYDSPGHRKFSDEEVRLMRQMKASGYSYSQIESRFGVSHGGLMKIVARRTYRNVE